MEDNLLVIRWIDDKTGRVFDVTAQEKLPTLNHPTRLEGYEDEYVKPVSVQAVSRLDRVYAVTAERWTQ